MDFEGLNNRPSKFYLLNRLVKALLVFPHSSAEIERVFKEVTNIKTENRNRLEGENLRNLVMAHNRKRQRVIEEPDPMEYVKKKRRQENFIDMIFD